MSFHDSTGYASLDTRRNDGLNHTSLDILNQKKSHKTHTQKQFQQFNKQQKQVYLQQQRQATQSTMSFHSQQSFDFVPPLYKHPKASFSSQNSSLQQPQGTVVPQGQWFGGGAERDGDVNLDRFSNFTGSPDLQYEGWELTRIGELEEENQLLLDEINKFQEFRELNEVLIEENEILREKLSIVKANNEYSSSSKDDDLIRLKQSNEDHELTISKFERERQSFQLQLESLQQEMTKLKLINIENNKAKNNEIEALKEENDQLSKELDVLYQKEAHTSALTSLESTPKSIPQANTPTEDAHVKIRNSEFTEFKLPTQQLPQRTPPMMNQKTFQQSAALYDNDELVSDLLVTIRQLKSDNMLLLKQKENVASNLARQKKFVKKFIDNNQKSKVKTRKGFNLVETIDLLI